MKRHKVVRRPQVRQHKTQRSRDPNSPLYSSNANDNFWRAAKSKFLFLLSFFF